MSDYERHGEGVCHYPCNGDRSVACGELNSGVLLVMIWMLINDFLHVYDVLYFSCCSSFIDGFPGYSSWRNVDILCISFGWFGTSCLVREMILSFCFLGT